MAVAFECATVSGRSASEMFDRARDIDAHLGSQANAHEVAIGGVTGGLIGPGEEVTWRARHFGIPFTLSSRVTEYDRPHRFVDEQVRGPFESFRHEHLFEPRARGSVMIDRVSFTAPFGFVGRLAERAVLAHYLRELIAERGRFLAR